MKWVIAVLLGALLFGVLIYFKLVASERDPLAIAYVFEKPVSVEMLSVPTSKALAEVIEPMAVDQLVKRFRISVADGAVIEYFNKQQPELVSDESAAQEREQMRVLGVALTRVVRGETAQTVYDDMASQLPMGQFEWLTFTEQSANQATVDAIQAVAAQPNSELIEERVESLRDIFVRRSIKKRACDLDDVRAAILAHARADRADPIELDSLRQEKDDWHYYCAVAYGDWLNSYFSEHVQIKNPTYDGYRQYMTLFTTLLVE